jgi:hypothetical protein
MLKSTTAAMAIALALLGAPLATAADKPCPYPGDDWELSKPSSTSDQRVKDSSDCITSPMAPPMIDDRGNVTKDCRYVNIHMRFMLACMGMKGYVLAPPHAAQQQSPRPDR